MNEEQIKLKVQKRIVIISGLILIGKFIAYFVTNSVGVLTDAMESIVNVVAGLISLYCLRWGAKPGDKEHPFGHRTRKNRAYISIGRRNPDQCGWSHDYLRSY